MSIYREKLQKLRSKLGKLLSKRSYEKSKKMSKSYDSSHHPKHIVYPFTAIVGQEQMKKALILNAVNPQIGGMLIRGEKGTAKSTAVRGLADLLPEIEVVADCPFNCNPHDLREMCGSCESRFRSDEELPIIKRKMLVVDLPINATEDRVIGTLDIEKAIREGTKALEPGILADANRGILYIDEVNLLDDHVADVLLDAAAMGVNIVEREGISVYHPSEFILIGTMNPEEGELRPQLLDRFGLSVRVERIQDVERRTQIVKSRENFDADPQAFREKFEEDQNELRRRIEKTRKLLPNVIISDDLLRMVNQVCIDFDVDGLRADIVSVKAAKAIVALDGRREVTEDDILEAMDLTLGHRMRKQPFERPEIDVDQLRQVLNQARQRKEEEPDQNTTSEPTIPKEQVFDIGRPIQTGEVLERRKDRVLRTSIGKRAKTLTKSKRGRYVKPRIPTGKVRDIALDATIRAAALRGDEKLSIAEEDIREKVRVGKTASLITFVVDASGSMGACERMKAAKGAIFSLLRDAYQKRDKVAMVVFRKNQAEVLLPPTRSVDFAVERLQELPTGGKTPLPAGILKGIDVIEKELVKSDSIIPIMVLVTDGKANVPIQNDVFEDLQRCAAQIKGKSLHTVVIDTETGLIRLELAREFAESCGASYHHIDSLQPHDITAIVRSEVDVHK